MQLSVGNCFGESANIPHDAAWLSGDAQERADLYHHHDDADTRHEARDDRVGRIGDEPPDSNDAQQDLDQSRHHDHGESLGQITLRVNSDNRGHGDAHGAGGPGHQ